jgi:hypothetical protein
MLRCEEMLCDMVIQQTWPDNEIVFKLPVICVCVQDKEVRDAHNFICDRKFSKSGTFALKCPQLLNS